MEAVETRGCFQDGHYRYDLAIISRMMPFCQAKCQPGERRQSLSDLGAPGSLVAAYRLMHCSLSPPF